MKLIRIASFVLASFVLRAAAVTYYVDLNSPIPTPPYTNWDTAANNIQDAIDAAAPGDTVLVTNGVYDIGGRIVYGTLMNRVVIDKAVAVQSVNGAGSTFIHGYQSPFTINDDSAIRCAYLTNGASLVGFTLAVGATRSSGDTATEQRGGGAWCESSEALVSDCLIVSNSAFSAGGGANSGTFSNCTFIGNEAGGGGAAYLSLLTSCVVVSNMAGAGGGLLDAEASHCLFVENYARDGGGAAYGGTLSDCVLTNNAVGDAGGGVWGSTLNRCLVIMNTAGRHSGAGVGTFNSCIVISNSANRFAGAGIGKFNNCTIVGNSASEGGGVYEATLHNCIVYYNSADNGENHIYSSIDNSCTIPLPGGSGNITNEPAFADLAGGDFHLSSNSPCINAGNSVFVEYVADFDGAPRVAAGTVDIGAYESQAPGSVLSFAWAQQNGLATDGSADFSDVDGDGANNWQEWRADTTPTNAASAFRINTATNSDLGLVVSWASVATRSYFVERAVHLEAAPFQVIASNITGIADATTFTDTTATNSGPYFYRVGVE